MVSHAFAGTVAILRAWRSALWGKIAICLSEVCNGASFAFFLMPLADLQTLRIPRSRNRMGNHSFFWRPFSDILFILLSYIYSHFCAQKKPANYQLVSHCIFKTTYMLTFPWDHYFLRFLGQALTRLVTVSSMHYCTSTSALSTSSSSRGFTSFEWDISS